jgi:hypothetical protein
LRAQPALQQLPVGFFYDIFAPKGDRQQQEQGIQEIENEHISL